VNGDGYSDVIIGAHQYYSCSGRAYVYHGASSGLITAPPAAILYSDIPYGGGCYGYSVASAGDVNGDGYGDVIVGAPYYNSYNTGRAFVHHGDGGSGLSLIPQQKRVDADRPIGFLGKSDKVDAFRLSALGRTPYGRGKVKLQWEVKPRTVLFDGTGLGESADWHDTGVAGFSFLEQVSSLVQNFQYHWRVRLLYDNVTTPLQPYSRWLTPVWNGAEESDFRTNDPVTVIDLVSFTASPLLSGIILDWETGAEIDTAGFYLLRSLTGGGGYETITALIPSEGGPSEGAAYSYTDEDVKPETTYYYKLEDVDTRGEGMFHGPVSARLTTPPITLLSPEGPFPADPPVFAWEAGGITRVRLQFSRNPAFDKRIRTIPVGAHTTSYVPTPAKWKAIARFMGAAKTLYWRVTGKDGNGKMVRSEALKLTR
jgi:hypothetical protein